MTEALLSLFGVLFGGLVTWGVAHLYYVKAGEELSAEAERIRKMTTLILRALEQSGQAEFSRDSDDNIVGMKFSITGSSKITLTPSATMTFRSAKDQSNSTSVSAEKDKNDDPFDL